MTTFETLTLFFSLLTSLGAFVAWLITREKANDAIVLSRKANQIANTANALAENANSLFKESLKLSNKQFQILIQPKISIRLSSEFPNPEGFMESTWELKNIGKGPAIDLTIDFLSHQVYGKIKSYQAKELAPNVTPRIEFTTDPKYQPKKTGNTKSIEIELPDRLEEAIKNMSWIWFFIHFKNEDLSQKFIQFIRVVKYQKNKDWVIEISDPSIHNNEDQG
ncbi:MAG TPA: hypothetical protein DGG95_13240 [Cytophagales bacterium]|jgi:hypothetical protein|nr:hypothetical protein [Cytophagales bacterium]